MKLRNKKTGIMGSIEYDLRTIYPLTGEPLLTVRYKDTKGITCYIDYKTVAEFNDNWEDYKPAEPLIKDERNRKAVRAWAEALGRTKTFVVSYNVEYHDCCIYTSELSDTAMIDLGTDLNVREGCYSIAELCGEEEE
jgi:hypothetical protein